MDDEEALFTQATAIASQVDREAFLDHACGDDVDLRRRMERLLAAHDRPVDLFEQPAAVHLGLEAPDELRSEQIDGFEIVRELGRGGMGIVYEAIQTNPVRRRVALKLVKPGMDTAEVLARFAAERQALALMDHPYISKVLGAGTTAAGRSYFVMELIAGTSITRFCDEQQLSLRQRLELFQLVCHAVQHAHQKGVIHRDLKPNNILVVEQDGRPVPKAIDFGVVKATQEPLTRDTLVTRPGQFVGTPEYMSPEQADWNARDIDTRTDVYSLGVVLYELLTGACPFDRETLENKAFEELLRFIREETPPRPSIRLNTIESLAESAAARQIEPRRFSSYLRGELDWIAMKALEKDRSRRYDSAASLAADVQRFLDDDRVLARPPSTGYRFRKFALRNKAVLATAAVVFLSLAVGLVGAASQMLRAQRAEAEAVSESRRNYVMRLSAESRVQKEDAPILSVLLAEEAVKSSRREDGPTFRIALESLLNALVDVTGRPLPIGTIDSLAMADHGLATLSLSGEVRLWKHGPKNLTASSRRIATIQREGATVELVANGHWLALRGDRFARWDLSSRDPKYAPLSLNDLATDATSFAVSRDGRWLFSRSSGGRVSLWDLSRDEVLATGQVIGTSEHELYSGKKMRPSGRWDVHEVGIGQGGRWAFSTHAGTASFWSLEDGGAVHASTDVEIEGEFVTAVTTSHDGRWLAVGNHGSPASKTWLFDLTSEDAPASRRDWESNVLHGSEMLAFGPRGRWFFTGSNQLRQWDVDADSVVESLAVLAQQSAYGGVLAGVVSPHGTLLATGGGDGTVAVWRLDDDGAQRAPRELRGHESPIRQLAIRPDGKWIAALAQDGTIRSWNLSTDTIEESELALRIDEDLDRPSFAVSRDGRWIATTVADHRVQLWNLTGDGPGTSQVLSAHRDLVYRIEFSYDERWMATGSQDKSVRLWDLTSKGVKESVLLMTLALDQEGSYPNKVQSLVFSPDDRWLVIGDEYGALILFDLQSDDSADSLRHLDGHEGAIREIEFGPHGRWMATASEDGTARLWDMTANDPASHSVVLEGHSRGVWSVEFDASGRHVFTGSSDGTVKLWDVGSGNPASAMRTYDGRGPIGCISLSLDGRYLAAGRFSNAFLLWDLRKPISDGNPREMPGHHRGVYCSVSPDGKWLATGDQQGKVKLWAISEEDPLSRPISLRAHRGRITSFHFTADGRRLFTRSNDGAVRIWDLDADAMLARARSIAGRELTFQERREFFIDP